MNAVYGDNYGQKRLFLELISVFMTPYYLIPKRGKLAKNISGQLKELLKKFSPKGYTRFFKQEGVCDFFKVLKISGFIRKMIEAYENMKK